MAYVRNMTEGDYPPGAKYVGPSISAAHRRSYAEHDQLHQTRSMGHWNFLKINRTILAFGAFVAAFAGGILIGGLL